MEPDQLAIFEEDYWHSGTEGLFSGRPTHSLQGRAQLFVGEFAIVEIGFGHWVIVHRLLVRCS
jgi:hypothetical protein